MPETNLSTSLSITQYKADYDQNLKHLLADRQVLARILKYAAEEFSDMPIDKIMESIDENIEIGTIPLDAGLSNLGRVAGTNTENTVPHEGTIYFDIRFTANRKPEHLKILLNVEGQRSSNAGKLGYHLENRILFYLARMISAQKQTEFFHSDYDRLKRVHSIWICLDSKKGREGIEQIRLENVPLYGTQYLPDKLDLMKATVIHIHSNAKKPTSPNPLISMLETLFSKMSATEKKEILKQDHHMIMTTELEGRIHTMCNISDFIEERALEEGRKLERLTSIKRMIDAGFQKNQILSCGYTEEEYENGILCTLTT